MPETSTASPGGSTAVATPPAAPAVLTIPIAQLDRTRVAEAGGKGANLGELVRAGLPVPEGFVLTSAAFDLFLEAGGLRETIATLPLAAVFSNPDELRREAERRRARLLAAPMPDAVAMAVHAGLRALDDGAVAVRSSATVEDSDKQSFAGMFESFLNVTDVAALLRAVRECWASACGARLLAYRAEHGLEEPPRMAVIVQRMVTADKAGVMFSVDPATGDATRLVIEAAWGLGEVVVGGQVIPDRYVVDKPSGAILQRVAGRKDLLLRRDPRTGQTLREDLTDDQRRTALVLSDGEVAKLATLAAKVEAHYGAPQDMEFAVAGERCYVLQTRPVTARRPHAGAPAGGAPAVGTVLAHGLGASPGVASGAARTVRAPSEGGALQQGEVLVAPMTAPDWVATMRRAAAIVTDAGGMTSHAAIVAREFGIPCVVGTLSATSAITAGTVVTVDGAGGTVYAGRPGGAHVAVPRLQKAEPAPVPASVAAPAAPLVTATRVYVNLADPDQAQAVAARDVDGVGLLRAEFLLLGALGNTHPRALVRDGRGEEFVARMAAGLRRIAAPFGSRPVLYRTTDFRSNEFRALSGGEAFEPHEENPMLGYRGCYRYLQEPDLFALELEAVAHARRDYPTLHLMLPFVRTLAELEGCCALIDRSPLGADAALELWVMAEVPSIAFWLPHLAALGVHGVSIGSNDLTQLMLGVDRDSARLASRFDERDPAVMDMVRHIVTGCRAHGLRSSICGQAPTTYPDYVDHLVEWGIDSVSVNPDAIERARRQVAAAERRLLVEAARVAGSAPARDR